jgi:hypothetical protein
MTNQITPPSLADGIEQRKKEKQKERALCRLLLLHPHNYFRTLLLILILIRAKRANHPDCTTVTTRSRETPVDARLPQPPTTASSDQISSQDKTPPFLFFSTPPPRSRSPLKAAHEEAVGLQFSRQSMPRLSQRASSQAPAAEGVGVVYAASEAQALRDQPPSNRIGSKAV